MPELTIGYVNVYVSDLDKAASFSDLDGNVYYLDQMGGS